MTDHTFPHPHPFFHLMSGGRGRHHGRHRGGPGGGGPGGFGPPFGFGPFGGRGFKRGPGARRGDVRDALLLLLAEQPRNGYQLMQEIEERSDGAWRPSPGSVYPALSQLEDEGLVVSAAAEGATGKVFSLTDAGREQVEARDPEQETPWDALSGNVDDEVRSLGQSIKQFWPAIVQVMQAGSPAQQAEAKTVLDDARRKVYGILAEDPPDEEA
jgi:DNA-binding PadR family transcriptional regulator